jgi:uncharacterized protein (DUF1501 family)
MLTRRDFLKSSALLSLAPTVPGFLARTARATPPQRDSRVLVVLQLDGGNDGLNTLVPYADPEYARLRPTLKVATNRVLKMNDALGLHPSLGGFAKLLEAGRFGVVPGVGYPNPSRSHFRSMAIWHSARFDPEEHGGLGWLGRALDGSDKAGNPAALLVGPEAPPVALRGRRSVAAALDRVEDLTLTEPLSSRAAPTPAPADDLVTYVRRSSLDAYATADRLAGMAGKGTDATYPETNLGRRMRLTARLLKADLGTRVFYAIQSGYDTHASQNFTHAQLLNELGGAVKAFFDDMQSAGLAERVALMVFSEFGRTVKENGSAGTDHGTAAPVFLAGPAIKTGVTGAEPSLTKLVAGEPTMTTDFRRVYATLLEDWLGLPAEAAVGGKFEKIPLLKA